MIDSAILDVETALFYSFLGVIFLVLATLIGLLIHSGFFAEIEVITCKPVIGKIQIAYKSAKGPYQNAGSLFTEIHSLLPQYRTLGIYYDNPKKKEANHLRYIVGIILSENDSPVKDEELTQLKANGYNFMTLPLVNHAVQTSFPFRSTLSVIIAIFRVYPILDEYIESRTLCAYPFLEIYDNEQKKIHFLAPLEQQDCFFAPEITAMDEALNTQDEETDEHSMDSNEQTSQGEDSSNTSSSFEEIEESDALINK